MKISLEEAKELHHKKGVTWEKVAVIAGISPSALYARFNPEGHRADCRRYRSTHREKHNKHRRAYVKRKREEDPTSLRINNLKWRIKYQDKSIFMATEQRRPWDIWELAYLEEYGPQKTTFELTLELGRTFGAVRSAATRYNISLNKEEKPPS